MERIVQRATDYLSERYSKSGDVFCQKLYEESQVVDVSKDADGVVNVVFKVFTSPELRNSMGMVHGGASSTIVSIFTQLALAADTGKYFQGGAVVNDTELQRFADDLGVTRAIDVQILQAVPLETDVFVKVRLLSNTRSNAYATAAIYTSTGRLLVTGTHDFMKTSPHL